MLHISYLFCRCVRNKCVAVKQENSSLNTHLINVKKNLMEKGILKSDVSHEVDCMYITFSHFQSYGC